MSSNNAKLESIEACYTKTQLMLRDLFLEYVNDYIGYKTIARHKGISGDCIIVMIAEGRAIHESIVDQYKQATS